MAEILRAAHSCHMHPFAAEQLARDRWDQMVQLAQAPRRRNRLVSWLRQLYVRRPVDDAANGYEPVEVFNPHGRQQTA